MKFLKARIETELGTVFASIRVLLIPTFLLRCTYSVSASSRRHPGVCAALCTRMRTPVVHSP
eukprot:871591-Rhodomonas_salina.1